ncbi:MAG: ATPase domain-containing protein [Candidatus Methanoperedens sp.]|nr:ATPase domain-containing protein [Candidatus Methanoperedens sp.]
MNNRIPEFPDKAGGKSLVYYTQPGVEAENYSMRMIYDSLRNGRTCVFVASSTSPASIKDQFRESGLDISPYYNRFIFVDAYNPLILAHSKEKYVISNPDDIIDFSKTMINLMKELPSSIIHFGSLSTVMDLCGEEETIEAVRIWNRMAKLYGHDIVYNFTAWPYSRKTLTTIQKELFTAVISIGSIAGTLLSYQRSGFPRSDCS